MIKVRIMAIGHRGKLQKTVIDFMEDEVKIMKMPLIKKHEKINDLYVHDMLYIHYPHVQ